MFFKVSTKYCLVSSAAAYSALRFYSAYKTSFCYLRKTHTAGKLPTRRLADSASPLPPVTLKSETFAGLSVYAGVRQVFAETVRLKHPDFEVTL